jgi:hypothetical protein
MANLLKWWGYLHENSSVHAKRVFEPTIKGDLEEASESPFVLHVFEPFNAQNRADALRELNIKAMAWLKTQK